MDRRWGVGEGGLGKPSRLLGTVGLAPSPVALKNLRRSPPAPKRCSGFWQLLTAQQHITSPFGGFAQNSSSRTGQVFLGN